MKSVQGERSPWRMHGPSKRLFERSYPSGQKYMFSAPDTFSRTKDVLNGYALPYPENGAGERQQVDYVYCCSKE